MPQTVVLVTLLDEIVAETALTFGYTFPGSVGIVFTMPNERLLIGETALDEADRKVFDMAKAQTPDQIAKHASPACESLNQKADQDVVRPFQYQVREDGQTHAHRVDRATQKSP